LFERRADAGVGCAGGGGVGVAVGERCEKTASDVGAGRGRGGLVGINTMHPNRLVEEAVRAGLVPERAGYEEVGRGVAYDRGCRVDSLLRGGRRRGDCA
jgi:DNA-binding sugar fermentation-stimulating protein